VPPSRPARCGNEGPNPRPHVSHYTTFRLAPWPTPPGSAHGRPGVGLQRVDVARRDGRRRAHLLRDTSIWKHEAPAGAGSGRTCVSGESVTRPDPGMPPVPAGSAEETLSGDWARGAWDEAAFAREQAALGRLWTFLGMVADVAEDGQWFRTVLGGRSIFVQRFGEEIRGFENRCAHRLHPLRTGDRGRGPVVCAFHHWRYNKDGLALGIPVCDEAFGTSPKALDARLAPVELGVCGGLLFGRFPSPGHSESLADFLGDTAPLMETLCPARGRARRIGGEIRANWKFLTHIGLDDYHLVAVHPTTFGRNGYLKAADVTYARFGRHSLYTTEAGDDPAGRILAACRAGTYLPRDYVILNVFPSLGLSQFHAVDLFGRAHYRVLAYRYAPLAPGLSRLDGWLLPAPEPAARRGVRGVIDRIAAAAVSRIVPFHVRRVMGEDNAVCERLQTMARQMDAPQRLSPAFEARIGWFEEACAAALRGASAPAGAEPQPPPDPPPT